MPFALQLDEDRKFVRVVAEGDITAEVSRSLAREAGRLGSEHGVRLFLFDLRAATISVDECDTYDMAASPEDDGLTRIDKRAVVYAPGERDPEFFENVSVNRGYRVRCFTDIDAAVQWLTGTT